MKLLLTTLALAAIAFGRDKTDVLVMKNGDRITCEIKKLEGGVLVASLDYVDGNISIDWQKVDRIESTALFAIKLEDGTTLAGTMTPLQNPANAVNANPVVEIKPVDTEPVTVDQYKVVGLDQASLRFWNRFNGGATIGSQYAKGNNTTQYSFSSDVAYQESRWAVRLHYNSSFSSSSGADPATRNQADLSGYRLLKYRNTFYQGGVTYLQSSVQGIERQVGVTGGLGYFLKNSNRVQWSVQAGPAWQRTHYDQTVLALETQNIIGAIFGTNWDSFRFKKTRLTVSAYTMPALNDLGRVFSRGNLTYYFKLFGKIDWNLSAYGSWDNHPPPLLQGSDYGTSTGFSYSFGNH